MISFLLILSFSPISELSPPSISYSLSISLYANHNPPFLLSALFSWTLINYSQRTVPGDRSCNYLLVLTRVQRSEISISNNNGVRDAGSCVLGIWQVSRLLKPTWGEGNPHRGQCPREGGRGHFCFVRGKFQRILYACWGKMIDLSSNIPAVNTASIPTHSGASVNLRQAGDCSCYSYPPDFKLHTFFSFAKCKKTPGK